MYDGTSYVFSPEATCLQTAAWLYSTQPGSMFMIKGVGKKKLAGIAKNFLAC